MQEIKSTIIESKYQMSCEEYINNNMMYNGLNANEMNSSHIMKSIQDNDHGKMDHYS